MLVNWETILRLFRFSIENMNYCGGYRPIMRAGIVAEFAFSKFPNNIYWRGFKLQMSLNK